MSHRPPDDPGDGRAAPSPTRRLLAGAAALTLLAASLLALRPPETAPAVSAAEPAKARPERRPRVDWWDWGINRVLTPAERGLVQGMGGSALFSLAGAIYLVGDQPTWTPQGRPGGAATGLEVHLVVRLDSELGRTIDARLAPVLVPILVSGFARNRTPATVGLQLDCDVPTKRLAAYAGFLHELRRQLPPEVQLSVTMLLDWARSPSLAALGREVDFVAPQFYNALTPVDPGDTSASMGGGVAKVVKRLEAAGVSYRLGLPTYEQCSVFDARGDLQRTSIPLSPEAAIAAGGAVRRIGRGDETTIEVAFARAAQAGGIALDAGSRLLFARLSADGLARQFAMLRELAPPRCLGVCLFHLPGTEATRSLSIAQVAAAHAGRVRPADLRARVQSTGNGHWALFISNQGDDDWLDAAAPARVSLQAPGHLVTLAGARPSQPFLFSYPTAAGRPAAPGENADGCAVDIALLRAEQVVVVEDIRIDPPPTSARDLVGGVTAGGARRAIEATLATPVSAP